MIHLRLRTEYSFRSRAFGRIPDVLAAAGGTAAAITDAGTWGHVQWVKNCKKIGVKPILGVEIAVVYDAEARERQRTAVMAFLARSNAGLRALYEMTSLANRQFYNTPRLSYRQVNELTEDIIVLSGINPDLNALRNRPQVYLQLTPGGGEWNRIASMARGWSRVVSVDNLYPSSTDSLLYELHASFALQSRTTPMHVMTEWELRAELPMSTDDDFANTERIASMCDASLPVAENIRVSSPMSLLELCRQGAVSRGLNFTPPYEARLQRELRMIADKKFEDYFYVIADLVRAAKQRMLVGPGRGSSSGSLVCYLLGITDVDPITHGLMFERFIDVTRADLPDIDLDFPDVHRDSVMEYLRERYGSDRVGRIGTVLRYAAKSSIGIVAKQLGIPAYETKDLLGAIVDRSSGDARAQFAVADTLESLDIGKALVAKYPSLVLAGQMEGHAQTNGTHAAGVIVCNEPVTWYCSIDYTGTAQLDKKDAEALNMLKIDALGLRTLSVLQDCLEQIGKPREWLVSYPLDDTEAFEVFNAERWNGVFQFEGYAVQSLTRQMKVHEFNDLVALVALARPGPLHSGAASEFIERRVGRVPVTYMHELARELTAETFGIVIYQEQVMAIGRVIGQLSWEDVSELRKAMSKSLGDEFFSKYWDKFAAGAAGHGIPPIEARAIWDKICTFGSWAFNKSHAVVYGLLSYWCAVLKARYPLEYAAACLRNEKTSDSSIKVLRDLVKEGFTFQPVDATLSGLTWTVANGKLIGGLTNIKGVGTSKAQQILDCRAAGKTLPPGLRAKLAAPQTPFDDIFEARRRFGDMYTNPTKYNVDSGPIWHIDQIDEAGEYVFIGKLVEKNLRDLNEYNTAQKRGGTLIADHTVFLNMTVEDDTGSIKIQIGRYQYEQMGRNIVETAKIGDWFLWKGRIRDTWRVVSIQKYRLLSSGGERESVTSSLSHEAHDA